MRATTALLALTLAACGARTAPAVHTDGATPMCAPGPRPVPGMTTATTYTDPPAAVAVVVDDGAGHALWIGGLSSDGVYSERIGMVDTRTGAYRALTIAGEAVMLPAASAGVWDAPNGRAVVLGGTHGGADLAQVMTVTVSGDTATVHRLADLPDAVVSIPAAVYDPTHHRVVVSSFLTGGPPDILLAARGTYALDLSSSSGSWTLLVPPDASPPTALSGETGWMAYDPASRRIVLVRGGNRFSEGSLWTLDVDAPTHWVSAGPLALGLEHYAFSGLVADGASCGLLMLAVDGHCGFELVWLGVTADGSMTVDVRGDAMQMRGSRVMASGSVVFSPDRATAWVIRGFDCSTPSDIDDGRVQIPFTR